MPLDDGFYRIVNRAVALPIEPNTDALESIIVDSNDDGTNAFIWVMSNVDGNQFKIKNKKNDLYLSVADDSAEGTMVAMLDTAQTFSVEPISKTGYYWIKTLGIKKLYCALNKKVPGAHIELTSNGDQLLSHWTLDKVKSLQDA